jgi:hypothetical protein
MWMKLISCVGKFHNKSILVFTLRQAQGEDRLNLHAEPVEASSQNFCEERS